MGASYEETLTIPVIADAVWDRVVQALNQLPGVVEVWEDQGALIAAVDKTWKSWGENITVRVFPEAEGSSVQIRSECLYPKQIVAWGKNKTNVKTLKAGLESSSRTNGGQS